MGPSWHFKILFIGALIFYLTYLYVFLKFFICKKFKKSLIYGVSHVYKDQKVITLIWFHEHIRMRR